MTEIVPGLWIGGLPAIEETREMDLIVNLEGGKVYPDRPTFLWVIGDGPALPDVRTLDLVVGMIDTALTAGQRVLVHCTAGLNRSGLVVGRVLIRRRLNGREAVALLRARHDPQALNNATFAHYLETFGWVAEPDARVDEGIEPEYEALIVRLARWYASRSGGNPDGTQEDFAQQGRIGYVRAARVVDQLEEKGIVGPSQGSSPRDVLVGVDELERVLRHGAKRPSEADDA